MEIKKCPICQSELPLEANFCPYCMTKLMSEDGTELQSSEVAYGTVPVYNGTPTKAADAQYTYTFSCWDYEINPVTEDKTYTAVYSSTLNQYQITFVNYDGTELYSALVDYDEVPVYGGEDPIKPATDQYTYTFSGWTPDILYVTGEKTYTATYTETINVYTVKFVNYENL